MRERERERERERGGGRGGGGKKEIQVVREKKGINGGISLQVFNMHFAGVSTRGCGITKHIVRIGVVRTIVFLLQ